MRRYGWLLLCGALLAPPVLAANPAGRAAEPDPRAQELSSELNQFVEDAIRGGLLAPAGSGVRRVEEPASQPEPLSAPADISASPAGFVCGPIYVLDFSDFRDLSQYQDIISYRQAAPVRENGGMPDDPVLAKAYIALDLSSEAVMSLGRPDEAGEVSLHRLATMLEGRARPDVDYFRALTDCHPQAEFWLAVAELVAGEASGAARLDNHLNDFRRLPLQLRARVAALTIPALDKRGEALIAHKMVAGFSPEEIANSSQLRFAQAMIDLTNGNAAAEATIRTFLLQSRFQEEALGSLVRNGRPIDAPMRAMLLDGMLLKLEQVERDDDVRASLRFVLDELAGQSRYVTMLEMAGRENMQSTAAQDEIRRHFVAAMERDLTGADPLRQLAALEALAVETGLLDTHPGRSALYEAATLQAVKLGFSSLATGLSAKSGAPVMLDEGRARRAWLTKDYAAVYTVADANPQSTRISLIAALSALEAKDTAQLRRFETRLKQDAEAVLALIEQDAASRSWMVSSEIYDAAGLATDEALKARARRVLALRRASGEAPVAAAPLSMAGVPDRLSQTRARLNILEGEAH